MTTIPKRKPKNVLNQGNISSISDALAESSAGSILSLAPKSIRKAVVSHVMTLPNDAKAKVILAAYAVAGTLTTALTPVIGSTVATGEVGIANNGDVLFAAADAVTEAEVVYIACDGEVYTETLSVASNVATPLGSKKAHCLISVESTAGTTKGVFAVEVRGATPATGEACINDAGNVVFAAADAVTECKVTYIAFPGVGVEKNPGFELLTEQ